MAHLALYRRWRPQSFAALVGQQAVKTALANGLASGRIAHAYLFTGPRGTGKTSTARILAMALNCQQGPTAQPCGHCSNCTTIASGSSLDVLEIDAASNRGIDEIKTLREQMAFTPVDGPYKVYIIDEVHMLTTEAFNALLKTLEEPPSHVIFILATTDPQKIPATIHSRCQRFDFRRVTLEEIVEHLALVAKESNIAVEREALKLIGLQAEGGMRDALSLLDQCSVMDSPVTTATVRQVLGIVGQEAMRQLVAAIGSKNLTSTLALFNSLLQQGKDVGQLLTELVDYLRALLLYKSAPDYEEIYLTDTKEELEKLAPLFGSNRLMAAEERLNAALLELKHTLRTKITAELCFFDLCRQEGSTLAALTARVEELEAQLAQGITINTSGSQAGGTTQPASENTNQATAPAAAAKTSQADSSQTASSPAATKEQPKSLRPKLPPRQQAQESAVETGQVDVGQDYWRQALELLRNEKKLSICSCAQGGQVVGFVKNVLRVSFKNGFMCERMKKEDYTKALQDALLRVARIAIRLDCVMAGAPKAPVQIQATKPVEPAAPPVAKEELPANLQKAMDVLGGTLEKNY